MQSCFGPRQHQIYCCPTQASGASPTIAGAFAVQTRVIEALLKARQNRRTIFPSKGARGPRGSSSLASHQTQAGVACPSGLCYPITIPKAGRTSLNLQFVGQFKTVISTRRTHAKYKAASMQAVSSNVSQAGCSLPVDHSTQWQKRGPCASLVHAPVDPLVKRDFEHPAPWPSSEAKALARSHVSRPEQS